MNEILKQRLVGALILVALGVVFWPIIFVEPGHQSAGEQARIPPRPVVDSKPIELPGMADIRPSPKPVAHQAQSQAALAEPAAEKLAVNEADPAPEKASAAIAKASQRTRTEPPERPAVDADGVPIAWILQVASVSTIEKANALRDRLLTIKHKAYVKKIERGERDLYRVYIGPKFEKALLERDRAKIDAEFGVKSMITRYIP